MSNNYEFPRVPVTSSLDDILEKIEYVCNNTLIKYGKKYYKLQRGLPQGLAISSVLSSFYYAVLESKATKKIIKAANRNDTLHCVMRLTDDYLIISEDKAFVSDLIQILRQMASQNNFMFNSAKFKSNFKIFENQKKVYTDTIQWIGKTIHLKNMELEHLQLTNKKEAFYTVSIRF